jgi:hypothetical protein
MQTGQFRAGRGEGAEVRSERNARQFAFEIVGELGAVAGMVQQAVEEAVVEPVTGAVVPFVSASG